jgi:CheY-like chemotaxis protein
VSLHGGSVEVHSAGPGSGSILRVTLPLARRLRAMAESIPEEMPKHGKALYLALTGYGQAHDKMLSKAVGFDRHFIKPVDLEALLAALAEGDQRP